MDEDRAGSNTPIGTERRVEARPGIFGFLYPVIVDAPLPWQAPFSALQAILDGIETPAKPVGSVSRPPESRS